MSTLTIRAYGRPAPQGSHDVGANGHVMHSSNYLAAWRRQVAIATLTAVKAAGHAPGSLPLFGPGVPVHLHEVTMIVTDEQCRAADTDEPVGAPDWDKLLRATVDGLGDAHLFANDSQIVKSYDVSKVRPRADEQPGAIIIISDRPRSAAALEQGESMTTEYRISLERVISRDEQGFPSVVTAFELTGTAEQVRTVGLTAIGALLGAGQVTVVDSSTAREQQAELGTPDAPADEPKRPRGRPKKTAAPAAPAEPVAAGPVSESAPVAEPAPALAPQAPAQPVADAPAVQAAGDALQAHANAAAAAVPVAPAGRVNPFA